MVRFISVAVGASLLLGLFSELCLCMSVYTYIHAQFTGKDLNVFVASNYHPDFDFYILFTNDQCYWKITDSRPGAKEK